MNKEQELIERLKQLPDGEQKAKETKRMISLVRNLSGYREYPKYGIVSRSFVYKQTLLKEAERLVQANVIHEREDITPDETGRPTMASAGRFSRLYSPATTSPSEAILVTSFTDPSWTPLFGSIKGLVTEVGGLMTHGAVRDPLYVEIL